MVSNIFVGSCYAQSKITFATHTKPPLSQYLFEVQSRVFEKLGFQVEVLELPGRRVFKMVNSGKLDGDLCRVGNILSISDDNVSNYRKIDEAVVETRISLITKANVEIEQVNWKYVNTKKWHFY
jgi:hypothetical protein